MKIGSIDIEIVETGLPPSTEFIKTYIIKKDSSAVIVDPGPASRANRLLEQLEKLLKGYVLEGVLITHIHLDHYGAAPKIAQKYSVPVYVHPRAVPHVRDPTKLWESTLSVLGDEAYALGKPEPLEQRFVYATQDGEELNLGGIRVKIIHTPGHAPHHQVFIVEDTVLFSGDACGGYIDFIDAVFPVSPPGLRIDMYLDSMKKVLKNYQFEAVAPTHMSIALKGREAIERHLRQMVLWLKLVRERYPERKPLDLKILSEFDVETRKILENIRRVCVRVLLSLERSLDALVLEVKRLGDKVDEILRSELF